MRRLAFLISMILFVSWFFGGYLNEAEAKTIKLIKAGDSFPEIPMQMPADPVKLELSREHIWVPIGIINNYLLIKNSWKK